MARAGRPATPPPASGPGVLRLEQHQSLLRELLAAYARVAELERQLEALARPQAGQRPADEQLAALGSGGGGEPAAGAVNSLGPPEDTPPHPPPAKVVRPSWRCSRCHQPGHYARACRTEIEERQVAITQELAPLEPAPVQEMDDRYRSAPASPTRLAELRRQIAAGTYRPFAQLRKAVS